MIKLLALVLLCGSTAYAQPIVIHGNSHGLWSPNGSVANMPTLPTQSKATERSPVHTPEPEPEVEEEVEPVSDICPTYLSAPHLCESN